jgi:hypothetical protein
MICIVPQSPGPGPIDWHLHVTDLGEKCIPFARYVRPEPTCRVDSIFPDFDRLPIEVQFHVLSFCDSATLFQLMQTSATLRCEAKKLFWSDSDAWYYTDGSWLAAGGFQGKSFDDVNFLRQPQQIEIGFDNVQGLMTSNNHNDKLIRRFWRLVRRMFPQVQRVVISENTPTKTQSLSLENVQRIAQVAPSGIEVFASVVTTGSGETKRARRYRARNLNSRWEVTDPEWVRQIILPPPKAWRGPVGEFSQFYYQYQRFMRMESARNLLLIEAIERSCFTEPGKIFRCPGPRCRVRLKSGREWAVHAVETEHYLHAKVPALYEKVFAAHDCTVKRGFREKVFYAEEAMYADYEKAGAFGRQDIRRIFLYQLEHDPQYAQGKPARKSQIWQSYLERIGEVLERD